MSRLIVNTLLYVFSLTVVRACLAGLLGAASGTFFSDSGMLAYVIAGLLGHLAVMAVDLFIELFQRSNDTQHDDASPAL